MNNLRRFKQQLAAISRYWDAEQYDKALIEVDSSLHTWPGNSHLYVLRACLIQLQEVPTHELEEAKQALLQAVEFDRGSSAAALELGHFLFNVEDNPIAASRSYEEAASIARKMLAEALIGKAKVLSQLEKREKLLQCLRELKIIDGLNEGLYAEQIQEIIRDKPADRRLKKHVPTARAS